MSPSNEVAAQLLLSLNSFKEGLEVPGTKAIKVVSLDDLNEYSGTIHHVLSHVSRKLKKEPKVNIPW